MQYNLLNQLTIMLEKLPEDPVRDLQNMNGVQEAKQTEMALVLRNS